MPLERDEGEYAYAGQLMLQGIPPYKLAYNMKLPGTYAAYGAMMGVFGQTISGIRLGLIVVNGATIVLIFLLGRRLVDDAAGLAAAVAYAVLGLAAHATHFVALPAVAGALLLVRASETGRPRSLLASGLLFGIAFVMKQHGILFGIFGFAYLAWVRARTQKEEFAWSKIRARAVAFNWMKYVRELGIFGAGCVLPYALTCILLWWAGVLPQFVFWTIAYANKYISAVPLANGSAIFRESVAAVTSPNLFFWLLAAFGAVLMWSDKRTRRGQFFLAGLFLCSAMSISIGLYFRAHYFILLLPALALLAGVAVSRGLYLLRHRQGAERLIAVPAIGLFLIGFCSSLIMHGEIWFTMPPEKVCRLTYGNALFPVAVDVGNNLRANSDAKASIAVLGSEPEIYFYSRRHSASGYIYMYPLREAHSYALKMQEDMIRQITAATPEYIVFVTLNESWLPQPGSKSILQEWWSGYWSTRYDLTRTINVEAEKTPGQETPAEEPGTVLIFKRKPEPAK
jgi:hypothetical protein